MARTKERRKLMGFNLDEIFERYGRPDPDTISILNKNGVDLSYVGHAEITRALCEIDENWTWEPVLGADGLPAIRIQHGHIPRRDKEPIQVDMATMWGKLTLCGVTRWAVGSVEAHKPDLDKELVSDFLRNAAMRFGIALTLWMKDASSQPVSQTRRMESGTDKRMPSVNVTQPAGQASEKQIAFAKSMLKAGKHKGPANLESLSKGEATALIDQLKAGTYRDADTSDVEEPF